MSIARSTDRLELPPSLRRQLLDFRRRLWTLKTLEAACAAGFGVVLAFLLLFGLDRVWETPAWPRATLFGLAVLGCALLPIALYRWVWARRKLEQLARLLARKHPRVGDQLLGIIELVRSDTEQARSRRLCEAAIEQVATDAQGRDLRDAVPNPRHRAWAILAGLAIAAAATVFALFPLAASNAWARLLAPWNAVPRYTFAAVKALPDHLVVPHGEPYTLTAELDQNSAWHPAVGRAQLGDQAAVTASLRDGRYAFEMPPQLDRGVVTLKIGDSVQRMRIDPTLRPELTAVAADVVLPEYLGREGSLRKDVRGGSISLVKGSQAQFEATANRPLAVGRVNGQPQTPEGATLSSPQAPVEGESAVVFAWEDTLGLTGKSPFTLKVSARDDEAPTVACEDLPRQKVVLDIEQLAFKVHAQDDFGVRRVGLEWRGVSDSVEKNPARGERVLAAGGPDKDALELAGTFSAKALGIEPQPIEVRVFVEDFYPDRPRVYSSTHLLYVLNAEQHAIWLTEQLSKWHRQSLEVRDRELALHETNKQLRALSPDQLDQPETRKRLENQALAERANGRRLSGLVESGEDLVQQAMRNPEFGVGHLEKWAEMLQILKDISANRMPSVAELLDEGARAPAVASQSRSNVGPVAGRVGSRGAPAAPSENPSQRKPPTAVPTIVDQESSQQPLDDKAQQQGSKSAPKSPSLRLPVTTLAGKPGSGGPPTPAEEKVDEAITQQRDLLAEFEKIADELNRVLANLEGSTLVKRLKAAARLEYKIAGRIGDQVDKAFGRPSQGIANESLAILGELAEQQGKESQVVSVIMDDMQAYFERRQFLRFKTVLDDMREQDVIGGLRQLGDDLKKEAGLSIAQSEYWSDSLDRWAEDLVDPTKSGQCPGCKSKGSLPPSIVLEVLQILEGEVNLREETRVAEQARAALETEDYAKQARTLSGSQKVLGERVDKVIDRIRELPDAEQEFGYEIGLLGQVSGVMSEATEILARPNTGSPAIAAETEAIELLLQSKRINPRGGGGGGSTPGGGGTGTTNDSAMALLGGGVNAKEVREDRGIVQATGNTGPALPEEFRAGLDEYFNRLERPATNP